MSQHTLQKVSLLLSLISVLVVVALGLMLTTKMDSIAAMQYGGEKNYILAQKLFANEKFQAQQAQQLQSALDQVNGTAPNPSAAVPAQQPTFPGGTLTQDQIAAIKKTAFVEGAANAKISIIEYSDPECPYCIRQYGDKTVENAVAAFPGSVNHIFKVVQGVNHPGTEYKSLAAICAGEQK
jgi:protein-disulfide isomerase